MKTVKCILATSTFLFFTLFFSSFNLPKDDKNSVENLKSRFYSLQYDKILVKKINDTAQLNLTPDWDKSIQIKKGKIGYTYIPIKEEIFINNSEKTNASRKNLKCEYLVVKEDKNELTYYRAILQSKNDISMYTGKAMVSNLTNGKNKVQFFNDGELNESASQNRENTCYYFICDYYSTCFGTWWFATTYSYGSCDCPSDNIAGCNTPPGYGGCGTGQLWWLSYSESYEVECP